MLELEEARKRILDAIELLPAQSIPFDHGLGRVLAAPVIAPVDLPLFDNSAMDGYGVRAVDLAAAGFGRGVSLRLQGRIPAGQVYGGVLEGGHCIRLFTGSPLPKGADAVVMQEDTREDAQDSGLIWFQEKVKAGENVRYRGEDVRRGSTVLGEGDRLTPSRLSLLGALGVTHLWAGRQPVVAVLATGSELREGGVKLELGQIYESNRIGLAGLVEGVGGVPKVFALVSDTLEATERALREAFAQADAVVTSGGVSVGEYDFVKAAFANLGGELDFWRVAIKPGKPFVFGKCDGKPFFGVPGNPVSALVTFQLLVRPALVRMAGAKETGTPTVFGKLSESVSNPGDRRHFMRVIMDSEGGVRCVGGQASHRIGTLAQANGLVDVPPRTTLAGGDWVRVLMW